MFKGFILGLGLAAGFTVGMVAVGTIAIKTVTAEFVHMADQFQNATVDDLEEYRACIHANDANDARTTVGACFAPLKAWQGSPTFKAEWAKLMQSDARVHRIVSAYNAAASEDEADLAFGRIAVDRCTHASDLDACVLAQVGN